MQLKYVWNRRTASSDETERPAIPRDWSRLVPLTVRMLPVAVAFRATELLPGERIESGVGVSLLDLVET